MATKAKNETTTTQTASISIEELEAIITSKLSPVEEVKSGYVTCTSEAQTKKIHDVLKISSISVVDGDAILEYIDGSTDKFPAVMAVVYALNDSTDKMDRLSIFKSGKTIGKSCMPQLIKDQACLDSINQFRHETRAKLIDNKVSAMLDYIKANKLDGVELGTIYDFVESPLLLQKEDGKLIVVSSTQHPTMSGYTFTDEIIETSRRGTDYIYTVTAV